MYFWSILGWFQTTCSLDPASPIRIWWGGTLWTKGLNTPLITWKNYQIYRCSNVWSPEDLVRSWQLTPKSAKHFPATSGVTHHLHCLVHQGEKLLIKLKLLPKGLLLLLRCIRCIRSNPRQLLHLHISFVKQEIKDDFDWVISREMFYIGILFGNISGGIAFICLIERPWTSPFQRCDRAGRAGLPPWFPGSPKPMKRFQPIGL